MMTKRFHYSLTGRIVAWGFGLVLLSVLGSVVLYAMTGSPWLAIISTVTIGAALTALTGDRVMRRPHRVLAALHDAIQALRSGDFSVSIHERGQDDLSRVVSQYNGLGLALRTERQNLFQRELLLDTIVQSTPLALVLVNAHGTVLYSNIAARRLLAGGLKLEGLDLDAVIETMPVGLREAVRAFGDSLFTMEISGEPEVFHVSKSEFRLNAKMHRLYLLKQLTREINAQEVSTWKKVIRVIAHELNNSIEPLSSLAYSGRMIVKAPQAEHLERIFVTIEQRVAHLREFIEGYARFAKLPKPRLAVVNWAEFTRSLRAAMPFELEEDLPQRPGFFDPTQMTQALINLLTNAHESGSAPDEVKVIIQMDVRGTQIDVCDRGKGMSEEVAASALLPFYSTKASGTGLGLALCREIVEAHGGRIKLANRLGGGLVVSVWLPAS
jgi:two-component system nitrogen regulation sensor histidine kinase NtrY